MDVDAPDVGHELEVPARPRSLDQLLSLEIPVAVSFGERELALSELAQLGAGSVVELDRPANSPIELVVNGRVIARGELLVVDDQYAVRITEVMSTTERVKSLGS